MSLPTPPQVAAARPERASAVLSARGVHLAFGPSVVLDDVSVEVAAGEVLALVGPNGAGKSTLLAVLAGDHLPDRGHVHLDTSDVRSIPLADLARRRAVLLQETRVSFPFLVDDVVRLGRAPWRGTAREDADDAVVAEVCATTEVGHLADRRYPTLSGGEKARAMFARVLAQEPGVLLLDEPTAPLDIRHQESVMCEVRRQARDGTAVVVVLHDLSLAAAYADRVVVLDAGRVRADGPPRDVLTSALLSEVYRHPVEVLERPGAGGVVIVPVRGDMTAGGGGGDDEQTEVGA